MQIKKYLKALIVILLAISMTGCVDMANINRTIPVNLVGGQQTSFEGEYLVRFDTGNDKYLTLEKGKENILANNAQIKDSTLDLKKLNIKAKEVKVTHGINIVSNIFSDSFSSAYFLKPKFDVQVKPNFANEYFEGEFKVIFPSVILVRDRIGAFAPSSIPEIKFVVKHHPKYSQYASAKLIPDFLSIFEGFKSWLMITMGFVGAWLIAKLLNEERDFSWWFVLGLCLSVLLFFLLPTFKNIYWIISGIWGN